MLYAFRRVVRSATQRNFGPFYSPCHIGAIYTSPRQLLTILQLYGAHVQEGGGSVFQHLLSSEGLRRDNWLLTAQPKPRK